jgi:hypothetical protein
MKKLLSMAMAFLNIDKLATQDGKPGLTSEQTAQLEATFGSEMLKLIQAQIAEMSTGATTDAPDDLAQATVALMTGMANQMKLAESNFQNKLERVITENGGLKATIDKLAELPVGDVVPEMDQRITRKANVPPVMRVDMRKPHYAAVGNFLQHGVRMANEAGDTIDVADLRTEFGTHLNTQAKLDIFRQILSDFETAQYMTTVQAVTEWRAAIAYITSVVQQFTPKWTPSGKAKFTPLTIKNYRHKINYPIVPADVLDSYMMYLYDEGMAPDQMPITKYITNTLLLPRILQDIEMRMIAKGEYEDVDWSAVADGDPGTPPEESMDGFETTLVKAKASGTTGILFFDQTINWLTATDQEVLDFVNAFVDWINPQYQSMRQPLFCSLDVYKRYKRAYKEIWGKNSGQDGDFGRDQIDFSNNVLTPLASMYNSPIIFATPKTNFIKLRHKNQLPNIINDVQKQDYTVKIFGEFWLGCGFAIGEAVFAYVPAGYNPKLAITETWGRFDTYQKYGEGESGSGSGSGGL